jgi:protoheme IX farnesyltransferase
MTVYSSPISSASESAIEPAAVSWRDYFQMTKPTITLLVVVTVFPGILLASPEQIPHMSLIMASLVGTWLASSSAAVFNHLVDADVDRHMDRTRKRPVASGRVMRRNAAIFATVLGMASVLVLSLWTTWLAAVIAVAANAFYVLFYTMYLKRRTVQNIVIGGAAGAVGPLIGWASVEPRIGWAAWMLFLVIFLWTPPHFWALALKYKDDYAAAGIPMMPVVRGEAATRVQMFWYTVSLLPVVASLSLFGAAGWFYLVFAMAFTLYFVWMAWVLMRTGDRQRAMPLFHYSCLYLFGIFGALMIDRLFFAL